MRKFLLCLMLSFCFNMYASDFPYGPYIEERIDQSNWELIKLRARHIYPSELCDCTDREKELYWNGSYNALNDIIKSRAHHKWVQENKLVWDGEKWMPRYGD